MLYSLLKHLVGICFNLLNFVLAGNLPPFGCVTVIVEEQGRYLLIQRPRGKLTFPSGFIRWREMPAEAAQRECEEETGLRLQINDPEDMIGCYGHVGRHIDTMSSLTVLYCGRVIGGRLRKSIEGQPYWLSEEEMLGKLEKRCEPILEDYLRYRARRAGLNSAGTLAGEMTKEDRHDSDSEGPVRGESERRPGDS